VLDIREHLGGPADRRAFVEHEHEDDAEDEHDLRL
jgi:hypothetical protein